ncbi:hypothetical protein KC340_g14108 [Hortaea werneckii]|nr:hypothetical protein KC342_g14709 [Hortaea werneckii]KAI7105434.1 hypothetical protein KC339_g3862 [Hortaea werneckii]KAI7207026.1 hypothetical protein KC365_g16790 [Hortaea werneckii]KAI7298894.1 hypothetical protein KC340_g14108 [Hortaea werneckii]KAI7381838.1 hypothetical protein KC328_g12019 [Hortaea werneckii]
MESDETSTENGVTVDSAYGSGGEEDLVYKDNAAFGHLKRLKDAVTKGPVSNETTLISLYQYDGRGGDDTLLKNLNGIVEPKGPCRIESLDPAVPYSIMAAVNEKCKLRLTYNKLLFAPTVRLECAIPGKSSSNVLLTLALEWPLYDPNGKETGVRDFYVDDRGDIVDFTAGRPTSSGFGRVSKVKSDMGEEQLRALRFLKELCRSEDVRSFTFKLDQSALTARDKLELDKIYDRLPSGIPKMLLPSIGRREYAAFPANYDSVPIYGEKDKIGAMIKTTPPFPMVHLPVADVFATLNEAAAELSMASTITERERNESLHLWASPQSPHQATLYAFGDHPILGIDFGKNKSLQQADKFTLPDRLSADVSFSLPGRYSEKHAAFHYPNALGLPKHDTYFVITSVDRSDFGELCYDLKTEAAARKTRNSVAKRPTSAERPQFKVTVEPHYNSFTSRGQLKTLGLLCDKDANQRWHRILLNQLHEAIGEVDMTEGVGISKKEKDEADRQLLNFMTWNAEQLKVIEGIRRAPDGMLVVLGPAGTGKTSLQEALAVYFWRLGYHVLALAPANSNADHLTRLMLKQAVEGLRCHRLYPSSRDLGLDKMGKGQAKHRRVGHEDGNATGSHEFFFLLARLEEHKNEKTTARDCGVEQAVYDEALKGELSLVKCLRTFAPNEDEYISEVDVWEVVRDGIHKLRDIQKHNEEVQRSNAKLEPGDRDWKPLKKLSPFKKASMDEAYGWCKAHIISETRFMITTTGNARSAELLNHFGRDMDGHKTCKGMIVFVDEACKDQEVNVWAPIVCEAWADKVKGVVLFGDEKQLNPINTNAKAKNGKPEFNPYSDRLSLSLPTRLVRQGFPYVALKAQMRMHKDLSSFVNRSFYGGALTDGSGTDVTLEECQPGLQKVLTRIIADQITNPAAAEKYLEDESEEKARQHWIELGEQHIGRPLMSDSGSRCYEAFADVFFESIFPGLHGHFGDRLEANVMRSYWSEKAKKIADEMGLTTAEFPKVIEFPKIITIDSSQGQESFMTIIDGSIKYRHRFGFMVDEGRCNVALSRSKHVRWVIAGPISSRSGRNQGPAARSYFPKLYDELEAEGMVHRFAKGRKARADYSA